MSPIALSPLAPETTPQLPIIDGLKISTAEAGIKYRGRHDVLLVQFERAAQIAGVFTRSRCASAPVEWCKTHLGTGTARALLVNSGNANAFTGREGREAVETSAKLTADAIGCAPEEVFLASTGVIGEPLPAQKYAAIMDTLATNGAATSEAWEAAARTIMTTDTFPKLASQTFELEGTRYTINGMAKGSGMIQPDMATMLSFLFTDAPLPASILQAALSGTIDRTFNSITVDSDTSTSDTVLLISLPGDRALIKPADTSGFEAALAALMKDLALQVVRDGEGAHKLVEITVTGAESEASARKVAFSVANSPLVKTAIAGEDANWGRIVMAVGKAGEPADRDLLSIYFGDVRVAESGTRFDGYSEEAASAVMQRDEIPIRIDLGLGSGSATVWTCDLTKDYVAINGDYRS
ncbi:bifunctional glutamate N-acetyltransferase/amino-acid acetyltransferase ArgJ [Pararhizobium sp. IMCC21322]|uniref:bifunctional glutamate N-acetyltransferase/amino-acid acetyltransferase ArgJ n=1 Tax=Pararhizobium sp. IMCC21322 TaxID=3067903 RepID=UPI0027421422|nr:bifunctional glutamate N-acetyltransferase/amino-acid acetyltransferase ArgJ [Pararhizobium sp. IMCC21322]